LKNIITKNIEKEESFFYFLNFIANFIAIAHENKVKPIGNTPLVSICGTCSRDMLPEEYIAATTGKATSYYSKFYFCVLGDFFFYVVCTQVYSNMLCLKGT